MVSEEESVQAGEVADAGLKREKERAESGRGRVEEKTGGLMMNDAVGKREIEGQERMDGRKERREWMIM